MPNFTTSASKGKADPDKLKKWLDELMLISDEVGINEDKTVLYVRGSYENMYKIESHLSVCPGGRVSGSVWGNDGIAEVLNRDHGWGVMKASIYPKTTMNLLVKDSRVGGRLHSR